MNDGRFIGTFVSSLRTFFSFFGEPAFFIIKNEKSVMISWRASSSILETPGSRRVAPPMRMRKKRRALYDYSCPTNSRNKSVYVMIPMSLSFSPTTGSPPTCQRSISSAASLRVVSGVTFTGSNTAAC